MTPRLLRMPGPHPPDLSWPPTPLESARYTGDMLENLRKIAVLQGQDVLAHLLELAEMKCRLIARRVAPPGMNAE